MKGEKMLQDLTLLMSKAVRLLKPYSILFINFIILMPNYMILVRFWHDLFEIGCCGDS